MIQVQQTIIDNIRGDCFRACLASLLELPIGQVPLHDTAKQYAQFDFYNDWLRQFNLQLAYLPVGSMPAPQGYFIFSVKSACFENCSHVVIAQENIDSGLIEVVWNPNPQDTRGCNIPQDDWQLIYMLAVIDPTRIIRDSK